VIVVDTNVIAYLYLTTDFTPQAEALLVHEPEWAAPLLWRSELRNVLAQYLRQGSLDFDTAFSIQSEAEALLAERELEVGSFDVLRLAQASGCSAYDCEFVALAQRLSVPLVTTDKKVLAAFPAVAIPLSRFSPVT
jgi:predicted nucleic acid-binding protein